MADLTTKLVIKGDGSGAAAAAREVGGALKATDSQARALGSSLMDVAKGWIAFSAVQAVVGSLQSVASSVNTAAINVERLKTSLDFSTGGRGAQALADVTGAANRLGLDVNSAASAYAKFQAAALGTSLEGQKSRDVFLSVAQASSVLGLSADDTSGVLLALQQMVSKGTVQAEELRGQLGERLPGAFQIAARAMGVTTAELGNMLERGEVIASDFLPRFAAALDTQFGAASEKASERLGASMARASNAWTAFMQTIGEGAAPALKAVADDATSTLGLLTARLQQSQAEGSGFGRQLLDVTSYVSSYALGLNHLTDQFEPLLVQQTNARRKLAELRAEAAALPGGTGGFYLNAEIAQTARGLDEISTKLQALKLQSAGDGGRGGSSQFDDYTSRTRAQEEQRTARTAALLTLTNKLSGVSADYAKNLAVLNASYAAGEIPLKRYQELKAQLDEKEGGGKDRGQKARALADAESALTLASKKAGFDAELRLVDARDLDLEARRRAGTITERAAADESLAIDQDRLTVKARLVQAEIDLEEQRQTAAGDPAALKQKEAKLVALRAQLADVTNQIQQAPERAALKLDIQANDKGTNLFALPDDSAEILRRVQASRDAQQQLRDDAEQLNAGLIQDAEARGRALIAIEERQIRERLDLGALGDDARREAEDRLATYIAARNEQLAEQLKPTWQRMVESWSDTTRLMRDAHADMMDGLVRNGEDAFVQFAKTGKLNVRSLVDDMLSQMARLQYREFLGSDSGKGALGMLSGLVSSLIGGGSGLTIDTAGTGITNASTGSLASLGLGAGRADGGPVYPNTLHPVNERKVPELLNVAGRQFLMMGNNGGSVTPLDRMTSASAPASTSARSSGAGGMSLTVSPVINIDARTDRAQVQQLVSQGVQQAVSQAVSRVADLRSRGNRAFS